MGKRDCAIKAKGLAVYVASPSGALGFPFGFPSVFP